MENYIAGPANKSNWPNLPPCKPRRPFAFIAIDVDGVTQCQCNPQADYMEKARWYQAQGHDVAVRFVELQEADYEQEKAWKKAQYQ